MRNFNESTITDAVIERIKDAPDARVKEISASLIRHLHDFVRDVRLTEAEWAYAIEFLTRTGKTYSFGQRGLSSAGFALG
jgi:hydroxyquinol 1,2-dioxygenase